MNYRANREKNTPTKNNTVRRYRADSINIKIGSQQLPKLSCTELSRGCFHESSCSLSVYYGNKLSTQAQLIADYGDAMRDCTACQSSTLIGWALGTLQMREW